MKKRKALFFLLLIWGIGLIGSTFAYFSSFGLFENIFKTDNYSVETSEKFISPDDWLPGTTTEKIVDVKNTGKVPMAVRISYDERWEDLNGNIVSNDVNGLKAAIINLTNEDDWIYYDGYYYYYKVLEQNETTSIFMDSVTFNEKSLSESKCTTSEDGHIKNCTTAYGDYVGSTYYLTINIETAQFNKYKEAWETDVDIMNKDRDTLWKRIVSDSVIQSKGIKTLVEQDKKMYYYTSSNNSNVIFGNFCWNIVRTTETDGVKLLYNGLPMEGKCNNSGENSIIGKSMYNYFGFAHEDEYENEDFSPAYVGYMYNSVFETKQINLVDYYDAFIAFGASVAWNSKEYMLNDVITKKTSDLSEDEFSTHNYFCSTIDASTKCKIVYYIMRSSPNFPSVIEIKDGHTLDEELKLMLGLEDNDRDFFGITNKDSKYYLNKKDSLIKTTIDSWYENNLISFENYLEDTIWCNDRTIYDSTLLGKDGAILLIGSKYFGNTVDNPSFTCPRMIDSFTVNEKNGNGDLKYPVGMITVNEAYVVGADLLRINQSYWTLSTHSFINTYTQPIMVYDNGTINGDIAGVSQGVRPSISLKNSVELDYGDGTNDNPFVIKYKKS